MTISITNHGASCAYVSAPYFWRTKRRFVRDIDDQLAQAIVAGAWHDESALAHCEKKLGRQMTIGERGEWVGAWKQALLDYLGGDHGTI